MKATDHFKNTIKAYLDQRAETDYLFSFRYSLPEKKLEDCITYILNQVQKSGCNGFHDDEIFGMAVHFFDYPNLYKNLTSCTNQLIIIANNIKR